MNDLPRHLGLVPTGKVTKNVSFHGYEFDIEDEMWVLNKERTINTSFIRSFSPSIQNNIRSTLSYFAEHKSAAHTANIHREIKAYLSTGETTITEYGLLTFKSGLAKKGEYRVAVLRVFLKMMNILEFGALNDACLELLNGWRLSGNTKGTAVLSLDPEDGPFSDIEYEAILAGLDNAYAEDKINDEDYSIVQLFAATGRRPIQLVSLKIGDLRIDTKILGTPTYILNIPKAKIKGGSFRAAFTDFAITEHIGQVLNKHIKQAVIKMVGIIGRSLSEDEKNLLPLFPDYKELSILKGLPQQDVTDWLKIDRFHLIPKNIVSELKVIIDILKITSERTKALLKTTGYRFRYTLGTRAARENAGILTIATLLDHADTQNAGVYVQNHPDHATTISTIMNAPLLKYANAFQGRLVKDEPEAQEKLTGAGRIHTEGEQDNIGSCGTNAFCRDHAPVACYLCKKFMPWQDAPHHLVLRYLVEERDRIVRETGDLVIAAINDRAIIAVTQVIQQCTELSKSQDKNCV
ncbi:MAG: integrase [Psychroserpens sp.]|jgi:integrase